MNELSTHIEYLLLSHDCVVVPHFGAFMTLDAQAVRLDEEQLFFPPMRRVRFNADVTEDDGLLVASLRQTYGIDESQAKHRVQALVLDLRQQLLTEGQVDFGSIGLFTQDEDGHVEFSACQAGAVTPAFFGLDAFSIPKIDKSLVGARALGRRHSRSFMDADSHITIHISRRALRHVMTTAAAVLLCLICSVPLRDSTNAGSQALITLPGMAREKVQISPAPKPEPTVIPEQDVVSLGESTTAFAEVHKAENEVSIQPVEVELIAEEAKPITEEAKPQQPAQESPKSTTAEAKETPAAEVVDAAQKQTTEPSNNKVADAKPAGFAIVLASATSDANAKDFVRKLKDMGLTNARTYNNGRLTRVILDGYKTEADALDAKHQLQWSHDGFDDAWLLRP